MTKCILCDQIIKKNPQIWNLLVGKFQNNSLVCEYCFSKFQKISDKHCLLCFKDGKYEKICANCKYWSKNYQKARQHYSCFTYNEFMKNYFHEYKENGDIKLADVFTEYLKKQSIFKDYQVITFIPSSQGHFEKRKFNTVYELYKNAVTLTPLLEVKNDYGAQAKKSRSERLKTPQKFQLVKDISGIESILLVDDIYTTGRTINHGVDAILEKYPHMKIATFSLVR